MKRRITLVVDDDERRAAGYDALFPEDHQWAGVVVESVEDIPDPDRVQEFRVRVRTKATDDPLPTRELDRALQFLPSRTRGYGVTEVVSTEVER